MCAPSLFALPRLVVASVIHYIEAPKILLGRGHSIARVEFLCRLSATFLPVEILASLISRLLQIVGSRRLVLRFDREHSVHRGHAENNHGFTQAGHHPGNCSAPLMRELSPDVPFRQALFGSPAKFALRLES